MPPAVGMLQIDVFTNPYYAKRLQFDEAAGPEEAENEDNEAAMVHAGHVHMHTHGSHGQADCQAPAGTSSELLRRKVIAQVRNSCITSSRPLIDTTYSPPNVSSCSFCVYIYTHTHIYLCMNNRSSFHALFKSIGSSIRVEQRLITRPSLLLWKTPPDCDGKTTGKVPDLVVV